MSLNTGANLTTSVITSNPGVTQELAAQFKRAIDSSSNIRSWLDTILISLTGEMRLKYGLEVSRSHERNTPARKE